MKITRNHNYFYDQKTVKCFNNKRAAMKENIVSVNETEKWFSIKNINEHSTENEIVTIKTSPIKEKLSGNTRTQKSRRLSIISRLWRRRRFTFVQRMEPFKLSRRKKYSVGTFVSRKEKSSLLVRARSVELKDKTFK